MKRWIAIALCIVSAEFQPVFAAVPPEIPHQRSWQIFAPFLFAFTDNGESVFTGGGPACQAYKKQNYFHQDSAPISGGVSAAGLPQFITALQTSSGLLLLDSHGATDGSVAVEAFSADDVQGSIDANHALTEYNSIYGDLLNPGDLFVTRVSESPQYWVIGAAASLIQRIAAEHAIVYGTNCFGAVTGSSFVSSPGTTRDYLGFSAQSYTGSTFFQNDGTAVAQVVFNNMSGIARDGGVFANIPMSAAVPLAQSLVSGLSPTYDGSRAPDPRNMRLYNAPRLVMSDVNQDVSGDGSFSYSAYHYQFATSYPYNPGDNTPYPGTPGTSNFAKSGPLKITLRFSEPMDRFWSSFQVQLQFADGTTQDVTSGGTWDTAILTNDSWSVQTTLPSGGHDGKVVVAVRARKIPCGGQDVNNQELDTSGTGSSTAGTYDLSTNFLVDRTPPSVSAADNNTANIPNGSATKSPIVFLTVSDDGSGVNEVNFPGFEPYELGGSTEPTNIEFDDVTSGLNVVTVTDMAGNVSTFTVAENNVLPTITLNSSASGRLNYTSVAGSPPPGSDVAPDTYTVSVLDPTNTGITSVNVAGSASIVNCTPTLPAPPGRSFTVLDCTIAALAPGNAVFAVSNASGTSTIAWQAVRLC